jgi:hypothetical protein
MYSMLPEGWRTALLSAGEQAAKVEAASGRPPGRRPRAAHSHQLKAAARLTAVGGGQLLALLFRLLVRDLPRHLRGQLVNNRASFYYTAW